MLRGTKEGSLICPPGKIIEILYNKQNIFMLSWCVARPESGSLDLVVVLRVVLVVVAAAVSGTRVPIVVGGGGFLEELLQKF